MTMIDHAAARRAMLATALALASAGTALAAPAEVTIPGERAFPENITSTSDGTLYLGSIAEGGIVRVPPGAKAAEPWIAPGAQGSRSTFGLLADERSGTLWACSNDVSAMGVPGPSDAKGSSLKAFDLKTGAGKDSARLPGERAFCNDIAIGPDGSAYVTDTLQPHILRLRPGAKELEVWVEDPKLAPPAKGGGLDGIAFGSDGHVYVNTFTPGGLFRVEVKDGAAGAVTQLGTSRPLKNPDGIRPYGADSFLMAEGGGTLDLVRIEGDKAEIETLKDGLDGPVGVTRVGDVAYVPVGQLKYIFDPSLKGKRPTLPFTIVAVPLPAK